MNYVVISPNFPRSFAYFPQRLHGNGIRVLGIGEEPYDALSEILKKSLDEYYRVENMENYEEMLRAVAYFTFKYGKIHRIESHNEHWLLQDARLRTDFNVEGLKMDAIFNVKRKSLMKERFQAAGVPVAKGRVVHTLEAALDTAAEYGYPVVMKPDIGVGAKNTHLVEDAEALRRIYLDKAPEDYILEEFIPGNIVSFDGLVDQNGQVVFQSSFRFSGGIMDVVNHDLDSYYYVDRHPDAELRRMGAAVLEAFDLRERFFHMEFFIEENGYRALELNARIPGGYSVDMWNYAFDMDIFQIYADVVQGKPVATPEEAPYYCGYVGRKNSKRYVHSNEEVKEQFRGEILFQEPMPVIFARAMGDFAFMFRTSEEKELHHKLDYMLEKKPGDGSPT